MLWYICYAGRHGGLVVSMGYLQGVRLERGWTQAELVRRSGVSRQTLMRLETGRVTSARRDTVSRLAEALGVDEVVLDMQLLKGVRKIRKSSAHAVVPFRPREKGVG